MYRDSSEITEVLNIKMVAECSVYCKDKLNKFIEDIRITYVDMSNEKAVLKSLPPKA